jgi:hypothetical protein
MRSCMGVDVWDGCLFSHCVNRESLSSLLDGVGFTRRMCRVLNEDERSESVVRLRLGWSTGVVAHLLRHRHRHVTLDEWYTKP